MATETLMFAFNRKGPAHLIREDGDNLTWCGTQRQYRHATRPGTRAEVTCPKCLRQIAQNRPLSRGGS